MDFFPFIVVDKILKHHNFKDKNRTWESDRNGAYNNFMPFWCQFLTLLIVNYWKIINEKDVKDV